MNQKFERYVREDIVQFIPLHYRLIVGIGLVVAGFVLSSSIVGILLIPVGIVFCKDYRHYQETEATNQPSTAGSCATPSDVIQRLNSVLLLVASPKLWSTIGALCIFFLSFYALRWPRSGTFDFQIDGIAFSFSNTWQENIFLIFSLLSHPAIVPTASLLGMILAVYIIATRKVFWANAFLKGSFCIILGIVLAWLPLMLVDYCFAAGGGGCEGGSIIIILTLPAAVASLCAGVVYVIRGIIKHFSSRP